MIKSIYTIRGKIDSLPDMLTQAINLYPPNHPYQPTHWLITSSAVDELKRLAMTLTLPSEKTTIMGLPYEIALAEYDMTDCEVRLMGGMGHHVQIIIEDDANPEPPK